VLKLRPVIFGRLENCSGIIYDGDTMKLGAKADWNAVYAEWKMASPGQREPNKDIWSLLPAETEWFWADVEGGDLDNLNIIGSSDWKEVFGSYKLKEVVGAVEMRAEDDRYRHTSRIREIALASREQQVFPSIILVAESLDGPFVAIDGNHRMAGFFMAGDLQGMQVLIGLSPKLSTEFKWFYWALKRKKESDMKIFVSVASYCDDLLFFTLKDCIAKATNPENIVFAVVDQNDQSQKELIDQLEFSDQIKYVYINKFETQGVSWARNIAFSLWDFEEYFLQIDSHTCFESGWDETLIKQLSDLQKEAAKPVISTYPFDFQLDDEGAPVYKEPSGKNAMVLRPHPDTVLSDDSAVLRFRAESVRSDKPVPGAHLAAGFIFTTGNFIEEIPYDPYLYFHGEEQSLSLRAYTRGWNIYHPVWTPLYHNYKKVDVSYSAQHWHESVRDKRALTTSYLKKRSKLRLNRLLFGDGIPGSAYGLGSERSLADYSEFSGINYPDKTISAPDK